MQKLKGIVKTKANRIALFVMYDIMALVISTFLSLWVRFDFGNIPEMYINNSISFILVDLVIMLFIFMIARLYISSWRYASVTELIEVISSVTIFEFVTFVYKNMFGFAVMPRSFYIIQFFLMVALIGGSRFSYRVLRFLVIKLDKGENKVNTMIVGAGEAGRLLVTEIHSNNSGFPNRICCFIDDNKQIKGTYLKGVPIVGGRKDIVEAVDKFGIEEIIIAIPSADKSEIAKIVEECQKTKCSIKILPPLSSMVNGNLMNKVKELSYEDFLGRDQIVTNLDEIINTIEDKVVMVTGGGGSIGSELCRQIAKCSPKQLIIFDIYENNAYDIQQELLRDYRNLNLEVIIGSVRDYDRVDKVFKKYKPELVFHAAAHKHVPLMEVSPNEAIKNNCLGTLNVAKLCDKHKTKKMVLISTDKAVRPTNVMGASKRICEMIIQAYDKKSTNTDYVAVRFGNVLGSNGSVIPLFLKQIENGGPVTVTHRKITRFFMTIPEAVSLILQASTYAEGGEIFVLDMGKPVRIYDLAEKLIRYKGYEPDVDIKIEITGLRPGEKLYEETLMDEEGMKSTPNKLIHIGKPIRMNYEKFMNDLDELIKASYKNNGDIKDMVAKIVPTYTVDKGDRKVDD